MQRWVPEVLHDSLPNGLQIYFTRVNDLPLAEINVIVDAGIMVEENDEHGVAYGVNQLLLAGSSNRTGAMISNYLAQLGSIVLPYTHYDYSQLYAKTLSKNFSATLGVIADAVSTPKFPEQELLRLQRDAALRLFRHSSSGEKATIAAVQSLCGESSAMSRTLLPTEEEVQALTLDQLHAFHSAWYQPQRTTVIITGNLDYRFIRTALIEAFGKWERGTATSQEQSFHGTMPLGTNKPVLLLADTTTPRGLAYFRMGCRIGARNGRDFAALMLLNSILGDGAESMLRKTLWGNHLISPNFSTTVAYSRDCSYFMISGSSSPMMTDSVLQSVDDMLVDIARHGVGEGALSAAREAMLAQDAITFASNRNLQSLLKEAVVYGIPVQVQFAVNETIRKVSVDDIQRVAREILQPDKMETVILGDAERIKPLIDATGRTALVRH
ncbi:MAG: insulinase family protein [Bacteroidetes bacterium]|nr:insulinase family protein [Bacteroidota bacterium]